MKMTVLEIVTDILSDMSSDEVNSINDTIEAMQIAQIVQTTYFNIIDGKDWPWLKELFQLTASGTSTKPSHMQIPETIVDISWIKYNTRKVTDTKNKFITITYKTPVEFMDLLDVRSSDANNIVVVTDYSGLSLNIL